MTDNPKEGHERSSEKSFVEKLQPLVLILFSIISFTILIIRVASYRADTPIEIINDVVEFSSDFKSASTQEINNYILLYWYDNMFIVAFGLFMAGLIHVVPLPKTLKLVLYCTSIPAHPICDWIENTAAVMAYVSFSESNDQTVDEKWINQYFLWSKIKWAMLAINSIAIIAGFSIHLRNRFCKKSSEQK